MRRALLTGLVLTAAVGCQSTGTRLLSLVRLTREPTVIAAVVERPTGAVAVLNPFPQYSALERAYEADTGRPASVEPCFLFQAQLGLDSGWYHCALLSPGQFVQLPNRDKLQVLAVARYADGRVCQAAVLVVPAAGDVDEVAELRGRSIAFGPRNDSLTHHAALQLLEQSGLARRDPALELLPVPGTLRHLPDGRAVARAVLRGEVAAGFMTEAEWEGLPPDRGLDTADGAAGGPTRNDLRILARTAALPRQLVVAPRRLSAERVREIRDFLLAAGQRHADAVAALSCTGYVSVTDELLAACHALRVREPEEPPESPSEPEE